MKNKTYLGLIASVIIFSSCAIVPNQDSSSKQSNTSQDNIVQTPEAAILSADMVNFNGALSLNDETFCKKIDQLDLQQKCLQILNGQKVTAEAVRLLNVDGCKTLPTEDQKACSSQVEVAQAQQAVAQAYIEKIDSENKAINSGNLKDCQQFQDKKLSDGCEFNILSNKAKNLKDSVAVCSEATSPEIKEKCQKFYQDVYAIPDIPSPPTLPNK